MPRQHGTGTMRCHDDELHRGARRADEQLPSRAFVEDVEVDFGEDDTWRRLALEAIDRFEQHVAVAIFAEPSRPRNDSTAMSCLRKPKARACVMARFVESTTASPVVSSYEATETSDPALAI